MSNAEVHRLINGLSDSEVLIAYAWAATLSDTSKPDCLEVLGRVCPSDLTSAAQSGREWADQSEAAGRSQEAQTLREAVALLESLAR